MSTARTAIGCLAEDYPAELRDICQAFVSHDSMGRGTIVYFRGITCDDAGDDEDD